MIDSPNRLLILTRIMEPVAFRNERQTPAFPHASAAPVDSTVYQLRIHQCESCGWKQASQRPHERTTEG